MTGVVLSSSVLWRDGLNVLASETRFGIGCASVSRLEHGLLAGAALLSSAWP